MAETVLITGAASGIGRALAIGALADGHAVLAVDRSAAGLDNLGQIASSGRLETMVSDLADADAYARIVRVAEGSFGAVSVLVNNAGVGQTMVNPGVVWAPVPLDAVTLELWELFIRVNATAPILLAQAVLPGMLAAKRGRIVTITTSLGSMLRGGQSLYGPSKAAAEAAMSVLAFDLEGTGVASTVLVPGATTNTGIFGDEMGDRSLMLQPEALMPPFRYIMEADAASVNGRRFVAVDWDASLPEEQAAAAASADIAWRSLGRLPVSQV